MSVEEFTQAVVGKTITEVIAAESNVTGAVDLDALVLEDGTRIEVGQEPVFIAEVEEE